MLREKKQKSTYWLLIQLALRARHDFARFAEKHYGLTGPQMHTLCLIEPGQANPMHTISSRLSCDASNVTGIIDRLAAQEYLLRADDPSDRRVKAIVLTPKGVLLRARILKDIEQFGLAYLQNLSEKEYRQFHSLLAKVTNSV